MYIEICKPDDESGRNVVKIIHNDPSSGDNVDLTFHTTHTVIVEVAEDAEAMLNRSRTNGVTLGTDPSGNVWLSGHKSLMRATLRLIKRSL